MSVEREAIARAIAATARADDWDRLPEWKRDDLTRSFLRHADAVLAVLRDVRGTVTPEPEVADLVTLVEQMVDERDGMIARGAAIVKRRVFARQIVEAVYRRVTPEPERAADPCVCPTDAEAMDCGRDCQLRLCATCGGTKNAPKVGYDEALTPEPCPDSFHGHILGGK